MIASIKLRTIAIVLAAVLLVAAICTAAIITTSAKTYNGKTVVLDAGHGGSDGGVLGAVTGTKESDINLAITKAVASYLEQAGYKVVLTRKNSDGLYDAGASSKKLSDMKKRKEIINQSNADMVVSIHQNFYPLESVCGGQVFFSPTSELSKEYAAATQRMINAGTGGERVAMKGDFYILECSPIPSVLVECGFLSNHAEEKLLVSADYQNKMAYLIFSAIHRVLMQGQTSEDSVFSDSF